MSEVLHSKSQNLSPRQGFPPLLYRNMELTTSQKLLLQKQLITMFWSSIDVSTRICSSLCKVFCLICFFFFIAFIQWLAHHSPPSFVIRMCLCSAVVHMFHLQKKVTFTVKWSVFCRRIEIKVVWLLTWLVNPAPLFHASLFVSGEFNIIQSQTLFKSLKTESVFERSEVILPGAIHWSSDLSAQ